MRDARFRHPTRTKRTGGFSRNAQLAFDARPTAAALVCEHAATAYTNRAFSDDDDMSSSSPSLSSESPPPLSSALAVPKRLLARLSPRRQDEHRAFRHLKRAARRLDLVASTRARRAETMRHLERAWKVARLLAEHDPTLAPVLTLLASSLAADANAEVTFSRLKSEAREGLRDAAKRLAVFATKNAFAAEALRDLAERSARDTFFARNATDEENATDDVERRKKKFYSARGSTPFDQSSLSDVSFSLTNAHVRFHEGLCRVETLIADRAFAALAGADPSANFFAPSAKTVFRDETRESVFFFRSECPENERGASREDRDGDRDGKRSSDPKPEPTRTKDDDDDAKTNDRVVVAIARPFVYPERPKVDDEKLVPPSPARRSSPEEHCFSQSELLTSSQREAIEGDGVGGRTKGSHGSVRLETVDFLDQAVRATRSRSPSSEAPV
jgi:hypothetical protein